MLEKLNENRFDEMFEIMQNSFPRDEYRQRSEQEKLFSDSRYTAYGLDLGNELCAFITVYELDGLAFVEHFAVNEKFRGHGTGSLVLAELKKLIPHRICLEVEPPETPTAKRRIAFYERNGFFLNEYDYCQPPFSADRSPVELRIMTTLGKLTRQEFEQIKHTLYTHIYHIKST